MRATSETIVRCRPCQMTLAESYTACNMSRLTLAVLPRGELRFELLERSHAEGQLGRDARLSIAATELQLVLSALTDAPIEPQDPDLGARVVQAIADGISSGTFPASLPGVRAWLSARGIRAVEWSWVRASVAA